MNKFNKLWYKYIWSKLQFPPKIEWLWNRLAAILYRNLNFTQAVALKLLKIIVVCIDASFQFFLTLIYHIIHHAVLWAITTAATADVCKET